MSDAKLKELKRVRGTIKGSLTRMKTFCDGLTSDSAQIYEINTRKAKLDELWNGFFDVQIKLKEIEGVDEEEVDEESESFENTFYQIMGRFESLSNIAPPRQIGADTEPDHPQGIKLPLINLPSFNGDYKMWLTFKDTYQSLIHKNVKLSNTQRFHYLKSCLKGQAFNLVQNLSISENSYLVAWESLCARYDNNRIIAQSHVNVLLNLPRIKNRSFSELTSLTNEYLKSVRALAHLGYHTESANFLLVPLLSSKLDEETLRKWEESMESNEIPSLQTLETFLIKQINILEVSDNFSKIKFSKGNIEKKEDNKKHIKTQAFVVKGSTGNTSVYKNSGNNKTKSNPSLSTGNKPLNSNIQFKVKCVICDDSHLLYKCDTFKSLSVQERINKIEALKLCKNCLFLSHEVKDCVSGMCKVCNKKHNTLLHTDAETSELVCSLSEKSSSTVVLATAIVNVSNAQNKTIQARVLLDSGAQGNFITEKMVQLLELTKYKSNIQKITGIADSVASVKNTVTANIQSRTTNYNKQLEFIVLSKITEKLPSQRLKISLEDIPPNIQLADHEFYKPNRIDVLVGAELFFDLIGKKRLKVNDTLPPFYETRLGWIACGKMQHDANSNKRTDLQTVLNCQHDSPVDLQEQLSHFWDLEHCPEADKSIFHDNKLDKFYLDTVTRNAEGRYIVSLPFKTKPESLGNSYDLSLHRFLSLERRLSRNSNIYNLYKEFMAEYIKAGHMSLLSEEDKNSKTMYYLPHHPVFREDSKTSKIRVVFNASMQTTSGISLNDILEKGPTIQDDSFTIILRFRTHKYALTADIEKMYRQILISPDNSNLQRIFWRNSPDENLKIYKLLTVTYGTTSAPYLAIRTLHQIANDNLENYPFGARVLLNDFYVDDVLTGADSIEELLELQRQLSEMLNKAGMNLRKWCSNYKNLIDHLQASDDPNYALTLLEDDSTKTLGMTWRPNYDDFTFKINISLKEKLTKRHVLSIIAKIYDPLGLLGPVITKAKIFMQQLWLLKLNWDDELPQELQDQWIQFSLNLEDLNNLEINRYFTTLDNPVEFTLHCFCDASEKAYGGCIYIRTVDTARNCSVQLLGSKSRVAPLKQISLPRLELCGALLVSNLYKKVVKALNIHVKNIYFWTDSTIVLCWLSSESSKWTTFVANRVSKIQKNTGDSLWYHVKSNLNPADSLSRGTDSKSFLENTMWLNGPDWLYESDTVWNIPSMDNQEISDPPEMRQKSINIFLVRNNSFDLIKNYSSWVKVIRIVATIFRFISNCKIKDKQIRIFSSFSITELTYARNVIIKLAQQEMFADELNSLNNKQSLKGTSRILNLNPFIDDIGILRVGGRLENALLSFEQKHPIIIDNKHHISKLICEYFHKLNFHIGPQGLLFKIRKQFWLLNGKNMCKSIVRNCIDCFKVKPRFHKHVMGTLPSERVSQNKPFFNTGIDYAGPILIKQHTRRNAPTIKGYICLFICFSTKAIHLEAVSDLTTEAFIAAFNRFLARRGPCTNIYSDNGSTFVGAANKFKELGILQSSKKHQEKVIDLYAKQGILWNFIPPYSPHFGGLWEAGIKSTKHHLRRVLKNKIPTFEELSTLLCQIESILNSRPLIPLTSNPDDLSILTPSHFLSLEPLPYLIHEEQSTNPLKRWQKLQQAYHQFWKKWSSEYLNHLQQMSKWATHHPSVDVGTLVIIKKENTPPLHWPLGRVIQTYPGSDGVVRVVKIRTQFGEVERAVAKLCPLPNQEFNEVSA